MEQIALWLGHNNDSLFTAAKFTAMTAVIAFFPLRRHKRWYLLILVTCWVLSFAYNYFTRGY